MATFDSQLREKMFEAYGYRCGVDSTKPCTQAHHIKPNTKVNNKKFPLFTQSPFNLMPINHEVHLNEPLPKPLSDLVCQVYEDWLQELKN